MRYLLAFIYLVFTCNLHAQNSFKYFYPFESQVSTFRALHVENDTLLLQGYFLDTVPPFLQGIAFSRVDSLGNLISYQRYFDSQARDLTFPPLNDIHKLSDGRYLTVSIALQDGTLQLIFLTREFQVDTIFEYFPNDPTVQVNWIRSVFELPDGYVVFGSAQRLTFASDGQIFKIRKNGDLEWRKWYGIPDKDEFIGDVLPYSDTTFLVASFHKPFPVSSDDKKKNTWIFEVDTSGKILNEFIDPDPFSGSSGGLVTDHEKNIYYAGGSIIEDQFDQHNSTGRIAKLDSNFQIQWKRGFGKNISINTGLDDMMLLGDSIIAVGTYVDTITIPDHGTRRPHLGWTVMANITGDSICERYDTAQWYTRISAYGILRAMDTLSSGSIVACGEGRFGPDDDYNDYAWLVKMSNLPCNGLKVSTDPIVHARKGWAVAPNPSSGSFTITLNNDANAHGLYFRLFNTEGRILKRFEIETNVEQHTVNIGDLPNGSYLLQSVDAQGRLTGVEKLVLLK